MPEFRLRAATEADDRVIKSLIHAVKINPMGLDWRRFVVAGSADGVILGCGQIKPHEPGVLELASIAVWPEFQGQGVARAIIERLIEANPGRLHLMCRSPLGVFYERFGFRETQGDEMPRYFRRMTRLARIMMHLSRESDFLMVMRRN